MTRQQQRSFRASFEHLEKREVMAASITSSLSGGVLLVQGTDQADNIGVARLNGKLYVAGSSYDVNQVSRIEIQAHGGNDTIRLNYESLGFNPLQKLTMVNAGDGNDVVYGSATVDIIFGGAGDDVLYGKDGNDLLFGGAGLDMLYGGYGNDVLDMTTFFMPLRQAELSGRSPLFLRSVYQMNCQGGTLVAEWQAVGAQVVGGTAGTSESTAKDNMMPTQYFNFLLHWRDGDSFTTANSKAFDDARFPPVVNLYDAIYGMMGHPEFVTDSRMVVHGTGSLTINSP